MTPQAIQQRPTPWLMEGIKQIGHDQFEAHARDQRGRDYLIGTYSSAREAEHAIFDALSAKWCG